MEANVYARTRADHQTETAEDYVELVLRLEAEHRPVRTVDLVEALGVAQPTVTKTLERLQKDGWVTVLPRRGVELTAAGRQLAESSLARHRLIEAFLVKLGVPTGQAALDAEGMEHHVSPLTLRAMARFLAKEG
jgi:DtxR family manganese transport transcriptional regulator